MAVTELPVFFFAGLKDSEQTKTLALDRRTVNFYPTENGEYLQNYPGKDWLFREGETNTVQQQGSSDYFSDYTSSEQPTGEHTRVIKFTDYFDIEHVVYCVDDKVYTVEGNGARLIHTMEGLGRGGTDDVVRRPYLFIHEQKLVILNHGDPPYVWDGVQGVVPVGVREIPNPPHVIPVQPVPNGEGGDGGTTTAYTNTFANPWKTNFNPNSQNNAEITDGVAVIYANEPRRWLINQNPRNGFDGEKDGNDSYISHIAVWRVQFVDYFGNKGKASAASVRHANIHVDNLSYGRANNVTTTIRDGQGWDGFTYTDEWQESALSQEYSGDWGTVWPLVQWNSPAIDEHITAVYVGRSINLNTSDPTPGDPNAIFMDWAQSNSTGTRYTAIDGDDVVAQGPLMDLTVGPPPSSEIGCSFSNRVWLVSLNRNSVYYSDSGFFGQFRDLQTVNPYSNVTGLVPAGDRLFIIGETSTEVYYMVADSTGTEYAALLEQDTKNGSRHGSTFVDAGDGIIFGLWSNGFGFYDGVSHKKVSEPYWLRDVYLEDMGRYTSAKVIGDYYYLSIRSEYVSERPNVVIMYNLITDNWYVVEESVNDICQYNEEILGVSDKIYVLFRGNTFPAARIRTAGLTVESQSFSRTLSGIRFLMEPSSFTDIDIKVEGEEIFNVATGKGKAYPSKNRIGRSFNQKPFGFWGDPVFRDGPLFDAKPHWLAPGDFWMVPEIEKPVVGFSHTIDVTFEAGYPVKIKAVGLSYAHTQSVAKGQ
tara:strand:+ start:1494 stop:3767 length:2274 start_codon:yes stop_codon:yes gene_type:complete